MSQALTDLSTGLIFFELELNRIDDAVLEAAFAADPELGALSPVVHRTAQGQALPARGPGRGTVPREVGDRRARPGTGCSTRPWRRSSSTSTARSWGSRATLNLLSRQGRDQARGGVPRALEDAARQRAALHPHHQRPRQGQGNLRPLARLQGHRRQPAPRQFGRARGGRCAGEGGARRLSAAQPPLLQDEGEVVRQGPAQRLGPQRAAADERRAHLRLGDGARPR